MFKAQPKYQAPQYSSPELNQAQQWTSFHLQKALPIMNASSLQATILSTRQLAGLEDRVQITCNISLIQKTLSLNLIATSERG